MAISNSYVELPEGNSGCEIEGCELVDTSTNDFGILCLDLAEKNWERKPPMLRV